MSSGHRDDPVRLRRLRAVCFAVSVSLTLLAVVTAVGLLPAPSAALASGPKQAEATAATADLGWMPGRVLAALADRVEQPAPEEAAPPVESSRVPDVSASEPADATPALDQPPPGELGVGRRVVFDLSAQQVWLVRSGGSVRSTYPVSGSDTDNLAPGRYEVYSRSRLATSYDYSSTMRWMVRFTEGDTAAIGFHSIPRDGDGNPVQTWQQLGTPQSHGCIRQRPRDARALWQFAPLGTTVLVVA